MYTLLYFIYSLYFFVQLKLEEMNDHYQDYLISTKTVLVNHEFKNIKYIS